MGADLARGPPVDARAASRLTRSGGLSEWRSARAPALGRGRLRVGRVAIDLPVEVAGS